MIGKIIAVVGAPGCGKSTLVKKLAKHYNGIPVLEGEEKDYPKRIIDDMANRNRNMELFVWWRNKLVTEMLKARKLSAKGKVVIMDTFWLNNNTYIKAFFKGFEKEIMEDLSELDGKFLPRPDVILVLSASESKTKEFIKRRNRSFDTSKEFFVWVKIVHAEHQRIFKRIPHTLFVDRTEMDFDNEADLRKITSAIDKL